MMHEEEIKVIDSFSEELRFESRKSFNGSGAKIGLIAGYEDLVTAKRRIMNGAGGSGRDKGD